MFLFLIETCNICYQCNFYDRGSKKKVVSALNIGIGVSAYRLRLMKKYRYRIGPKKSVSVDP